MITLIPTLREKDGFLQCVCKRLNKGGTADFRPLHSCYAEGFLLYKNSIFIYKQVKKMLLYA